MASLWSNSMLLRESFRSNRVWISFSAWLMALETSCRSTLLTISNVFSAINAKCKRKACHSGLSIGLQSGKPGGFMLRRSSALAALAALLIALPALPQTTVPDHERMEAAMRLASTLNPQESYRERLSTLYASMTPMFAQAAEQGTLPPD